MIWFKRFSIRRFSGNGWLNRNNRNQKDSIEFRVETRGKCLYKISVRTNDEVISGTDSAVFLTIFGEENQTKRVQLISSTLGPVEKFSPGTTNCFDLLLDEVGKVRWIFLLGRNENSSFSLGRKDSRNRNRNRRERSHAELAFRPNSNRKRSRSLQVRESFPFRRDSKFRKCSTIEKNERRKLRFEFERFFFVNFRWLVDSKFILFLDEGKKRKISNDSEKLVDEKSRKFCFSLKSFECETMLDLSTMSIKLKPSIRKQTEERRNSTRSNNDEICYKILVRLENPPIGEIPDEASLFLTIRGKEDSLPTQILHKTKKSKRISSEFSARDIGEVKKNRISSNRNQFFCLRFAASRSVKKKTSCQSVGSLLTWRFGAPMRNKCCSKKKTLFFILKKSFFFFKVFKSAEKSKKIKVSTFLRAIEVSFGSMF